MNFRLAVLTYHSINIAGNEYHDNDHVALAQDLRLLDRWGVPVLPLADAIEAIIEGRAPAARSAVALSCDDGSWFDWHDLLHPSHGPQASFRSVLASENRQRAEPVRISSFVIGSPDARAELDRTCLIGQGWWNDEWWPEAAAAGMDIENHSWDHNHDSLTQTAQRNGDKGGFKQIQTLHEAEAEIRQCSEYLARHCGRRSRLFAYPYGECNEYLVQDYLPRYGREQGLRAALTTEPRPISTGDDCWQLGRYVCGAHWRDPQGLQNLLRDAAVLT